MQKQASGMRPSNQFEALGMSTETVQEVEVLDVSMEDIEKKRDVETWRDKPILDLIRQKYSSRTCEGLVLHQWPERKGVVYKQVVENYWKAFEASTRDIVQASDEIFRRSEWLDEELSKVPRLEQEKEDLKGEVEEMRKVLLRSEAGKEEPEAKAKLLRSEVAREKAETEWKMLVEQRDKWRREAENAAKEKDKMEKDLQQELRVAKLAARRARTMTIATQTTPPKIRSTNTQTTETKPTYASVATQADSGKRDKGKRKTKQPAPTAATSASIAEDIVMRDWSAYEDLLDYEREAEVSAPRGAPTRTVRKRPTVTPAAPPAVTKPTGNAMSYRAIVVHGIGYQQPIAATILDTRRWGNVLGARWLLGKSRREGKTTISVVAFFDREVQVGPTMKILGKRHSVAAYDWDRAGGADRYRAGGIHSGGSPWVTHMYVISSLVDAQWPRFRPNKGFAHNLAIGIILHASIELKKKKKKAKSIASDHHPFSAVS